MFLFISLKIFFTLVNCVINYNTYFKYRKMDEKKNYKLITNVILCYSKLYILKVSEQGIWRQIPAWVCFI